MRKKTPESLSRRERQMMDIIYRKGSATAAEVLAELTDPPSYSAVRAKLRILEEKGHLKHKQQGPRYIFSPIVSREKAKRTAIKHILQTFFDGSAENAVATLLDVSRRDLSEDNLERLSRMIDQAKNEGR
jgi:predicted transcriptional regulator